MSTTSIHAEWLSLLDISGPFLATPVLNNVFPQGLAKLDPQKKKLLRQGYEEWREVIDDEDEQLEAIHQAWISLVLKQGLELDEDDDEENLKSDQSLLEKLSYLIPETDQPITPNYVLIDDQTDASLMLIKTYPHNEELNDTLKTQISQLCRANKIRLALITNGEQWMLVDAPEGSESTYASWYSRLWGAEPVTLQAFISLLGIRRFFVDVSEQLPALFDESLKHQDEVTDALGKQVSRAVEVLIQALDRADIDRNRKLLADTKAEEIYEAGLTIMMRLVFILSAEERGLLLLGDDRYESYYAISSLRMQLHNDTSEILERRFDAWARLLAVFRIVYAGVEHEALRLPALGSSLFDPDHFPFLEGRKEGTHWQETEAHPLPIDNRTVRLLLDAIQLYQGRTLSYRGLDVEQIGYVYEGLLERTVVRVKEVTLELDATKSSKKPWLTLQELEQAQQEGDTSLETLLKERTKSAVSQIRKDLNKIVDDISTEKLLTACQSNKELRDKLKPIFHLLKTDDWGYPLVYPENAFRVTKGNDRSDSGTHYTPKSLTEAIVKETLEPAVYLGPAEGKPRENWQLKSPDALLSLKICDPAMGSGAFLVQVCRWLSERLLEAWQASENKHEVITSEGEVLKELGRCEPLSKEIEERRLTARRLIVERCLYGVDINPMAVELAKLSIWLITLSKGRPFTFLDHNLCAGDSLLGIHHLDQLVHLHMNPKEGKILHRGLFSHEQNIKSVINNAVQLREAVQTCPIRDIHDIETMTQMDSAARKQLEVLTLLADNLTGLSLAYSNKPKEYKNHLIRLSVVANEYLQEGEHDLNSLRQKAQALLNNDLPTGKSSRQAVHWPLSFPEVFQREQSGFDAIVGNPPFLGGQKITGAMGTAYRNYLVHWVANEVKGSADLVAYFFLQVFRLLGEKSQFGLLAVNTISEGDTRDVGLRQLLNKMEAVIYTAYPDESWPGKAAVITSRLHIRKGKWDASALLSGSSVKKISYMLSSRDEFTPVKLTCNKKIVFQGSVILGMGFTLESHEAQLIVHNNPKYTKVLIPYLIGKEVNQSPTHTSNRWVINYWDWDINKAKGYIKTFQIVEDKVKPERYSLKDNPSARGYKNKWWLHGKNGISWLHTVGRGEYFYKHLQEWKNDNHFLEKVIVFATGATKYPCFTLVPNTYIFANSLCVVASESYALFASLTSDIHTIWAWKYGSRMKKDLRYTHGDIFETFPFIEGVLDNLQTEVTLELSKIGELFFNERKNHMVKHNKGMTKFYNDFHDPEISSDQLESLRKIQSQLNYLVLSQYGWDDIDLNIDFHEVSYLPNVKYIRYTMSEEARLELLYRLSMLNKERHEFEIQTSTPLKQTSTKNTKSSPVAQSDLFTTPAQTNMPTRTRNQWGDSTDDQILAWLEANTGWHPKQKIIIACQAKSTEWDKAIKELLAEDYIEKKQTGETAFYRAVQ